MALFKMNGRTVCRLAGWAAALTAVVSLARPALSDPPPSGPEVIAIANIEKIKESIHEYQDIVSQLRTEGEALKNTANDKATNINAMKQALSYLKSDSPQYADESDKLQKAAIEYDVWVKETQLSLDRKQKTMMKSLFLEIQDAIAQVAQKDGINLVLSDVRPPIPDNLDSVTADQLFSIISQTSVLYSDQSRDISGEVTTLLDKNYAAKVTPH